jgi:hypothetical protein
VVEHSVTGRWGPGFQAIREDRRQHGPARKLTAALLLHRRAEGRPGLERPAAAVPSDRGHRERGPQVPLAAGEIGENTCAHAFTDRAPAWSDARGPSHPGRPGTTCDHGPALITAHDGRAMPFGAGLRDQLRGAGL